MINKQENEIPKDDVFYKTKVFDESIKDLAPKNDENLHPLNKPSDLQGTVRVPEA